MREAGHAISTRESYLGLQDALRKVQAPEGSRTPGVWAGANVCVEEGMGVVLLTLQEKWDCMKDICWKWLSLLEQGSTKLNYKELQSDRGFMVYVMQVYPGIKPYLKGFHLSLETWRGGRDKVGWKAPSKRKQNKEKEEEGPTEMKDIKLALLTQLTSGRDNLTPGPPGGFTLAALHSQEDLKAVLYLAEGSQPAKRCIRSIWAHTACYGFGDASTAGFGLTVKCPGGIHGCFGLWGQDKEDSSSNYRELRNLVETVEEEAGAEHLTHSELWIFSNNSTAKSCFFRGGLSSKLLHKLVLQLCKVEMSHKFILHMVHVAGMRMIEQGMDGLSWGSFLEGVAIGRDMLSSLTLHSPPQSVTLSFRILSSPCWRPPPPGQPTSYWRDSAL